MSMATRASRDGDAFSASRHASAALSGATHASGSASSRYGASSSLAIPSASAATRRTHSFLGADDRVVLDIGASVLRAGYSGEARPRLVVSSLDQASTAEEKGRQSMRSSKGKDKEVQDDEGLWTLNIARCRDADERRKVQYRLKARLTRLLRKTLYDSLATDPKQRKVVIVENVLLPEMIKTALREILFKNLQIMAVSFVPSHLMTAVALGRSCVLTLDIGSEQTTLVPIYYWRPLVPRFVATTTRAAMRVKKRLRALLLHFGEFIPAPAASASTTSSIPERGTVKFEHLSSRFVDEIVAKALLVSKPSQSESGARYHVNRRPGVEGDAWEALRPFSTYAEEDDAAFMAHLKERYETGSNQARSMTIAIPAAAHPPLLPPSQPSTLAQQSVTTPKSPGTILIPGWIREKTLEVLFESGDPDEPSIIEIILDTALKLPVDVRSLMIANVYVSGGLAMLPGLAHRVRLELVQSLQEAGRKHENFAMRDLALTLPRVGLRHTSMHHNTNKDDETAEDTPTAPNLPTVRIDRTEMGEESFVSAHADDAAGDDTFQSAASEHTPLAKDHSSLPRSKSASSSMALPWQARYGPISQLASDVAVINDHAPRLSVEGKPISGQAPAFAPNITTWVGASLTGSLRIESLDNMTREAWEAAHAIRDKAKDDAPLTSPSREQAPAQGAATQAMSTLPLPGLLSPQRPGPRPLGSRPSLGSGRGSFLGSVGGLDLGSYGPLSDGGHGTFSGNADLRSPTRRPQQPPS